MDEKSEPGVEPRQHRESSITKTQPLDTNNIQISLEGEDDFINSYESGRYESLIVRHNFNIVIT